MMGSPLADIARWTVELVYSFGYAGLAVLTALGYLHLLVPTGVVLSLAGYLVGQGHFSFIWVLVVTTVAGAAGSLILYLPGLWISEYSLRRFIRRFGRFVFVYESDLDKASRMFERHGGKAVLIGHLVPGVTALVSIPAGIKRMPLYRSFMVYTILGTALWNGAHIGLGWALGSQWELVEQYGRVVEYVVLTTIALGILWFLWRRWKPRDRKS
jgi:membrane protein DedA with SNARE-associated domain